MEKKVGFKKGLAVLFLGLCALFADDSVQKLAKAKNGLNLEKFATNTQNSGVNLQNIGTNLENSIFNENQSLVKIQNSGENSAQIQANSLKIAQVSSEISAKSQENAAQNDEFEGEFDDFEAEFDGFKVNDPLSGYNKMMTSFNVGFYSYVARPVALGYDFIVPDFLQSAVKNLFTYVSMPIRFLGNVLQLKFKEAGTELKRFGINTVFGFFGLIDAASKAGVPIHHADFGLVLAHWGVGSGFHFVLPFLGPSNLRDTLSIPVNWYANPLSYIDAGAAVDFGGIFSLNWLSVGLRGFDIMNELSLNTGGLDEIYFNTPNLYPFLRDAYEKRRMELSK